MLLDPHDLVAREILATGSWEPESWAAMARHLPRGGTFVDVGAQIGYFSLKAAKHVGAEGRVVAIEPNPTTLVRLRANLQANGATSVSVQPFACFDSEATLDLFAGPATNSGTTSLSRENAEREGAGLGSFQARARPLDDMLAEAALSRLDVMKIDAEGAEFLVLRGARKTLARYRPCVFIELIEPLLKTMGASSAEVFELMASLGYVHNATVDSNAEFMFQESTAVAR